MSSYRDSAGRGIVALLLALLAAMTSFSPAAAMPAQPKPDKPGPATVTFGVQPASAGSGGAPAKPDVRGLFAYAVTPGGLLNDNVAFRNYSSAPITVRVYATDSEPTSDGQFALLPSATKPKDVGSWVAISGIKNGLITVPAQSYKVFPLQLRVPKDAQPGDHTGAVMASYDTTAKNKEGVNVRLEQRIGTRLKVRVSGPLRPRLLVQGLTASFEQPGAVFGRGRLRITYKVVNVGNVRLNGHQQVRVTGWFGVTAQTTDLAEVAELLPGSSIDVSTVVSVAAAGRLSVAATVVPAVPPGDPTVPLVDERHTVQVWALSWLWLAVLVVLAVLGYLVRRRRRAMRVTPADPPLARRSAGQVAVPMAKAKALRRSRRRLLAAVAALACAVMLPGAALIPAAHADVIGTVSFVPVKGLDVYPMSAFTSGQCPRGTNLIAKLYGKGFPPAGINVTSNTATKIYLKGSNGGLEVPLAQTMRTFADQQGPRTALGGRYDVVITCKEKASAISLGDFKGSFTFTSPTEYTSGDGKTPAATRLPEANDPRLPALRYDARAAAAARPAADSAAASSAAASKPIHSGSQTLRQVAIGGGVGLIAVAAFLAGRRKSSPVDVRS